MHWLTKLSWIITGKLLRAQGIFRYHVAPAATLGSVIYCDSLPVVPIQISAYCKLWIFYHLMATSESRRPWFQREPTTIWNIECSSLRHIWNILWNLFAFITPFHNFKSHFINRFFFIYVFITVFFLYQKHSAKHTYNTCWYVCCTWICSRYTYLLRRHYTCPDLSIARPHKNHELCSS